MNSARAARKLVARAPTRALHATARRRAVEDSPLSHSTPPKGRSPVPLVLGLTALLGGTYYYYATTESARIDESKHELERRAAQPAKIAEEAKLRAQEAARDARDRTVEGAKDVRESAEAKLAQAKGATERTYDDGKARVNSTVDAAQSKADDAKRYTEAKATEAKQTWWEWFGWGKDKVTHAADDLKRRANETEAQFVRRFEEVKAAAKAKGEDVVQRAGETEEQYRIRLARAVQRKD